MDVSLLHENATAQTTSCFPTCDTRDARFLTIAGSGISTFTGTTIRLGLATTAATDSIRIEIYDGETGGAWDIGTTPLDFTLYADPNGDGTGTTQVAQWSGSSMSDTTWYAATVANSAAAQAASGNYFYTLKVSSTNPMTSASSSFKVRLNGSITLKAGQSWNVIAPLPNLASARIVYPNYPNLDSTFYDGTWNLYIDVPNAVSSLTLWDGDMDHGNFDGSTKDDNDEDSPDLTLPLWAISTDAVLEGIGLGNLATDSLGNPNGDTATGAPSDDDRRTLFARSPSVFYEVVDPDGNHYVNANPSGNKEWEQFRISTAPFERALMDYHAESLPAGTYNLNVYGMDLANLNAFHLFFDLLGGRDAQFLGVDGSGGPVAPLRPTEENTGSVAGSIYFDGNTNSQRDSTEGGIGGVSLTLTADYDNDNVIDDTFGATTDPNGNYSFSALKNGAYKLRIDSVALGSDLEPTHDFDGLTTRHFAAFTLATGNNSKAPLFGYRRLISVSIAGPDTVTGSSTHTYTATASQTGATFQWSVSGAATISGSETGSSVDIISTNFGEFSVKVTATKNGSSTIASKRVVVTGIDFALFGYEYVSFKGRDNNSARGYITGNVGANRVASGCYWSYPTIELGTDCGENTVYMSDGTRVMGDYVDLNESVSVYKLYANRTTSSTGDATIRSTGPTSFSGRVIPTKNLPVIPSFSYGSSNYSVPTNATRTLAVGKYCTVTVNSGGTLNLGAGIYRIKSLRTGQNVTINTVAGTKVYIGRDFSLGNNSYVGPADAADFMVRGDGLCSYDPAVEFGCGIEFHGQVLSPNGKIWLGSNNEVTGRFWGETVCAGYDVNVDFYSPVNSLTTANNSGFQKRRAQMSAVTGLELLSVEQNVPNPFSTMTSLTFRMGFDEAVTVAIYDSYGNVVRTLIEGMALTTGEHAIQWDGRDDNGGELPSGTYFCRIQAGGEVGTKPVVLLRH